MSLFSSSPEIGDECHTCGVATEGRVIGCDGEAFCSHECTEDYRREKFAGPLPVDCETGGLNLTCHECESIWSLSPTEETDLYYCGMCETYYEVELNKIDAGDSE